MSQRLNGVISDRLRKLFTKDQILSNPHPDRGRTPTRKPVAKNVAGTQLSKPGRKTKK